MFVSRCQLLGIWATLFFTSLTPNIGLAFGDIFSDAYLVLEYHENMQNASFVRARAQECLNLKKERPIPLQAYAECLDSKSQFYYTLTFLLIPLIFYLTEFLTLKPEYEPTGLRRKLSLLWRDMCKKGLSISQYLSNCFLLVVYFSATALALILWQPVTACCKFYRDARLISRKERNK